MIQNFLQFYFFVRNLRSLLLLWRAARAPAEYSDNDQRSNQAHDNQTKNAEENDQRKRHRVLYLFPHIRMFYW